MARLSVLTEGPDAALQDRCGPIPDEGGIRHHICIFMSTMSCTILQAGEAGMHRNAALPSHDHEIEDLMNNEQWCVCYLFDLRWPDGFICPFCNRRQPQHEPRRKIVCKYCGKLSTVTSGTLLHSSKKQLSAWFKAIWWLIHNVPAITIKQLQKELGFTSYQTAWTWMGKLRLALQLFVSEQSRGTVVVGSGDFSGEHDEHGLQHFLMAVESIADGRMTGKVQMAHVESVDAVTVASFISRYIRSGSSVIVPKREPFTLPIDMAGYLYIIDDGDIAGTVLKSLMQRFDSWYARKKYRPANQRLTQGQLNEFCFIQTAHLYPNKRQLFDRLLTAAIQHGPVSADKFTGLAHQKRGGR